MEETARASVSNFSFDGAGNQEIGVAPRGVFTTHAWD